MHTALKRVFKLGMFSVLAVVALGISMVVGGNKKNGATTSATALGVGYTHADSPPAAGSDAGSRGGWDGCGCGSCGAGSAGNGCGGGSGSGCGSGSGGSSK